MPDAVIVSACRTAIGTARKGTLAETDPNVLGRAVVDESMQRTGIAPKDIDGLNLAESMYGGGVLARYIALEAGLTIVACTALNRHCAAGLVAVSKRSSASYPRVQILPRAFLVVSRCPTAS